MIWVLTTILCVILIEFAVRLPFPGVIAEILFVGRKSHHILMTGSVSDHWKEKAISAYAFVLFKSTVKLGAMLLTVGIAALLLIFMFGYLESAITEFIMSWRGVLYSVVMAAACFKVRNYFARRRIQPA